MSVKEDIDKDIKQFFNQIDGLLPEGKEEALRNLMNKYCHLTSAPILLDRRDFDAIKGYAHNYFIEKSFPKELGNRAIESNDVRTICIIEGTISLLNKKDCLKKLPKFDYKE